MRADVNYATLDSWGLYDTGTVSSLRGGYTWYWSGAYWNTTITHNGNPSIYNPAYVNEALAHNKYYNREVNRGWQGANVTDPLLTVKAGDEIYFCGWIKTAAGTTTPIYPHNGARFGIDFSDGYDWASGPSYNPEGDYPNPSEPTAGTYANYVPMGSDWTFREISFIVPSSWDNGDDTPLSTIAGMGIWFQVWTGNVAGEPQWEMGDAWFSDTELYINGLPTPTYPPTPPPTPTPSTSPTPTPTSSSYPYPTPTASLPVGISGIVSSSAVNLNYNNGESMKIQSTNPAYTITFSVTGGSWVGEATVTVTESNGLLAFQPTTSGSLAITPSTIALQVTVNDVAYSGAFNFQPGTTYYIRWNIGSIAPVTVISNHILYLRAQTQTTNEQVGYLLSPEQGSTNASSFWWTNGSATVNFGWVLWTVKDTGATTLLTSSTPSTVATMLANGEAYYNASVTIPERTLTIGKDAIKMMLYIKFDSGEWQPVASYITPQLLEKKIEDGTWQLTLYCKRYYDGSDTYATAYWGNVESCNSLISGVEFSTVLPQERALAMGLAGNFLGMIIYPYTIIGGDLLFYGMTLLFGTGLYYLRYKKFEPILILFIIGGGLVGAFIPVPAWRMFYFIILFVIAVVLFRVFH